MENERHLANSLVDSLESLKAETFPVCRIYTVDITDTSCEEVNTEISDLLALSRISALALTDNAVLFTADSAYLSLDRKTEIVSSVYELSCLSNVLVDREV